MPDQHPQTGQVSNLPPDITAGGGPQATDVMDRMLGGAQIGGPTNPVFAQEPVTNLNPPTPGMGNVYNPPASPQPYMPPQPATIGPYPTTATPPPVFQTPAPTVTPLGQVIPSTVPPGQQPIYNQPQQGQVAGQGNLQGLFGQNPNQPTVSPGTPGVPGPFQQGVQYSGVGQPPVAQPQPMPQEQPQPQQQQPPFQQQPEQPVEQPQQQLGQPGINGAPPVQFSPEQQVYLRDYLAQERATIEANIRAGLEKDNIAAEELKRDPYGTLAKIAPAIMIERFDEQKFVEDKFAEKWGTSGVQYNANEARDPKTMSYQMDKDIRDWEAEARQLKQESQNTINNREQEQMRGLEQAIATIKTKYGLDEASFYQLWNEIGSMPDSNKLELLVDNVMLRRGMNTQRQQIQEQATRAALPVSPADVGGYYPPQAPTQDDQLTRLFGAKPQREGISQYFPQVPAGQQYVGLSQVVA